MQPVTVLVVDNHPPVRKALRKALSFEKNLQVVGEAMNGEEAISKTEEFHPQVILMDVKMPKMNGLQATQYIKKHHPETKVIMLSAYDEKNLIDQAMKVGASAYLTKDKPLEEIIQIILRVCKGESFH